MNELNHVAIIMDGNGRWGLKKKNSRNYGHLKGLKTVEIVIRAAIEKLMVLSLSPARVLICGSLYLAGQVLDKHN